MKFLRSDSNPKKVKKEVKILETLRGGPNIVQIYDVLINKDKEVTIVTEFANSRGHH